MDKLNSIKGSQWRRWDLHIHTPATKLSDGFKSNGDVWDEYIEYLEKSPVHVFGITDYFSLDGYSNLIAKYHKKYPETNKVFFPNIELRLLDSISKDGGNPHVHVIFDNNEDNCSEEQIKGFLANLKTSERNENRVRIACSELNTEAAYKAATVSLENLEDALEKTFGDQQPYLIVTAGKNDGIKSTDSKSPRKVLISDEIDKASHIFFGDSKSRAWFLREDRYEKGESKPKPVIGGSDAHSFKELERLEGNTAGFEPTWVKADLTFRGLKQLCFEPESRVYIGQEPSVETRKLNQANKFLSELKINQLSSYYGANGEWFKDVSIPLNPELVAIIGNKGSGKSALVDIIGLLGESKQEEYFSFLSDKGNNKKFKQRGYAENFSAGIIWLSGVISTKKLSHSVEHTNPETVRYLPQNYFEQLTNEIEIEEFRKEIEDVVFSHVEESERMGKQTFSDLQDFKTQLSKHEINDLKNRLNSINEEIVILENKANPTFRKKIDGQLKSLREDLASIDKAKPVEVPKPDDENEEQKQLAKSLGEFTELRGELHDKGRSLLSELTLKKERLQKLETLNQQVSNLKSHIKQEKEALASSCKELDLDVNKIINSTIDTEPINSLITDVKAEIIQIELDNKLVFEKDVDSGALKTIPDVEAAVKHVDNEILALKEKLGTPQRKYQRYLEKITAWNTQRNSIIGEEEDPLNETIKYYENQIAYINDELSKELEQLKSDRREVVEKIFNSKKQVRAFYSDLKTSVESKLSSVRTDDFAVEIDSSFVVDRSFNDDFLNLINKSRAGNFHGSNNPGNKFKELISPVNWNDFESIYSLFDSILALMTVYNEEPIDISDQVEDVVGFYDFIFSLDYFSAKYELRLGNKNLNELSPGEKGLLLLVFYLQLDKDNIPLVIDQPEDNLDNDSIFTVLAECIRHAKKNRQVILVTHNPNLAVGADAEQIIYVRLEKSKNYKFSYETGAIENPKINRRIVNVLEGSQPAFVKRRLKYEI